MNYGLLSVFISIEENKSFSSVKQLAVASAKYFDYIRLCYEAYFCHTKSYEIERLAFFMSQDRFVLLCLSLEQTKLL